MEPSGFWGTFLLWISSLSEIVLPELRVAHCNPPKKLWSFCFTVLYNCLWVYLCCRINLGFYSGMDTNMAPDPNVVVCMSGREVDINNGLLTCKNRTFKYPAVYSEASFQMNIVKVIVYHFFGHFIMELYVWLCVHTSQLLMCMPNIS